MSDKYTILAIDDDPYILDAFQVIVEDLDNCDFYSAASFEQAKKIVDKHKIDLAFVDIVLPEIDGYEICKTLKSFPNTEDTFFILMSADKHHLLDRLKAYQVGAQQFISKPFDLKEVEFIIRGKMDFYSKKTVPVTDINSIGKFFIDEKTKNVTINNNKIDLTVMEYNLLKYLMANHDRFLDLDEIIIGIWGDINQTGDDNARSLIHRFRNKIEGDPKNPIYLVSTKKFGYIFYPLGVPADN